MSKPIIRVRDVMHKGFHEVDRWTTVADALLLMRNTQAKALIINKRNPDDEYGLVLLADIAKQVLAPGRAPERVNVYEIMAKPMVTVRPEMQVRYCARLLARFGLSVVPVVDQADKVIGLVSHEELTLRGLGSTL